MRTFGLTALLAAALALCGPTATLAAPRTVEVQTDQFERVITVLGPEANLNPIGGINRTWRLRSFIDKQTHAVTHQLWVEVLYQGLWAHFVMASDDTAKELRVSVLYHNASGCDRDRDCLRDEQLGILVDDATLRARRDTGYQVRLKAEDGSFVVLTFSPEMIGPQLDMVDKLIADPSAAALEGPQGSSDRDAAFGVTFDRPWAWEVRRDANHFHLPGMEEAMAVTIRHGSIADKAGLHWADAIYEFDGQPIENVQHLMELIRAEPAGKLVDFKVVHNGSLKTLHAQF